MKRIWRKIIAYMLAVIMYFNTINIHVYAQENFVRAVDIETETTDGFDDNNWDQLTTEKIFEGKNYRVIFTLVSCWDAGFNANIKMENTGESIIQNWYLGFSLNNYITNIWNAEISSKERNEYVVKNAGWNQDIAIGGSVEFGISGDHAFSGFPEKYDLISTNTEVEENNYTIWYNVDGDWNSGFYGSISVRNNIATPIEDWVLEFDFDREITEIWNGIIEEHNGNHYVIRNAGYNSIITSGECVSIGIKGGEGESGIEPVNFVLYSYQTIDESIKITINTDDLRRDERFGFYYVTDKTYGIKGSISSSDKVKSMLYEVNDCNGNTVETSDISVSDSWSATGMGFTLGANIITVRAELKSGKTIEETIIIVNDRIDRLSHELDFEDPDGDNIPNFVEQYFGTDCNNQDTDGDQLSDYNELYILGTDPTLNDTDGNGILDTFEDTDKDGLTAIDEIKWKTNPFDDDCDKDGLLDGDEVYQYYTKPNDKDTDGDGVEDGKEIQFATNPLVAEKTFDVTAFAKEEDTVKVSVSTSLSGNQVESLTVHKFDNSFLFPTTMPGYIGGVYDFNVDGMFSSAILKFEFDESLLLEERFDPVIYYYDEKEQLLEALPTTVTDNVATATVKHFSKYLLLDRTVYEDAFKWQDVWSDAGYSDVEVILVIDDSGSMYSNDHTNERLMVAKDLVDSLPEKSKIGIVKFENTTYLLTSTLTEDKEKAKSYLSTNYFRSYGGTYMYNAINSSFTLYESTDDTTLKMMIVLSDGATSDTGLHSSIVTTANRAGVKLYTVGLGRSTSYFNSYLEPLANNTGAAFYLASNSGQLKEIYKDISKKIDIETDSDGDGIADYYEDNMVMFNGVTIKLDKNNPDSDHDGLQDGEEIVEL